MKSQYEEFIPMILALHAQKMDCVEIRRRCEVTSELTDLAPPSVSLIHYIIKRSGLRPYKADKSWRDRNRKILEENEKGVGYKRLGRKYGLSKSRIQQIVKQTREKEYEKELTQV